MAGEFGILQHKGKRKTVCTPEELLQSSFGHIEAEARFLYIILQAFVEDGSERKTCSPTVCTLAAALGTCSRTVQRWLNVLIDAGLITREIHAGMPSIYLLNDPAIALALARESKRA